MAEYRDTLYDQYLTYFKSNGESDYADLFPDRAWYEFSEREHYEYHYGPFFRSIDRSAPILELGCGPGDMLYFLRERGFTNLHGIDLSEEQVEVARKYGLPAEVADVFDFLRGTTESYQAIVAKDFLEHFDKDELWTLTEVISDTLQEEGRALFETPNGRGLLPGQVIYGDLTHKTILTPQSLRQLLIPHGFGNVTFREVGPSPTHPLGVAQFVGWQAIRLGVNVVRLLEQGKMQKVWTENMICTCELVSQK